MKYPRYLRDNLLQTKKISPVTLLIGPRQCGKTTLIKMIGQDLGMNYVTFDTLSQLMAAQDDPEGFIRGLSTPVIIDEIPRVPEIALPIKLMVDEDRKAGVFGLTGSANPLVAPKLNDSLAGRMFVLPMWPLSMSEMEQKRSRFLELIFDRNAQFSETGGWDRQTMIVTFMREGSHA